MEEYNGYRLKSPKTRKETKYLVVFEGDLDLNGTYGFQHEEDLKEYLTEFGRTYAIFEVNDVTDKFI